MSYQDKESRVSGEIYLTPNMWMACTRAAHRLFDGDFAAMLEAALKQYFEANGIVED